MCLALYTTIWTSRFYEIIYTKTKFWILKLNVGHLCCVCASYLLCNTKICIALWYLLKSDFCPVITLNLLTVSFVIISLYTVLLTCLKAWMNEWMNECNQYDKRRFNVTVHYLQWRMLPFMCQCRGLLHKLAQCMNPQGWGKVVNAALLSLINEVCVNVCCTTLLSSELVGPTCVQARSSNPRGRVCSLMGRDRGRRGYWVTLYLYIYTARLF